MRSLRLRELVLTAHQADHGPERTRLVNEAHSYALATPGGTKGLRIDSRLTFDDEEIWVDASAVHPTPNSKEAPVTKWVKAHALAFVEAGGILANNAMLMEPSPCIRTAAAIKHNRYKALLDVAFTQHKAGGRAHMPTFVAAIISHTGEMAPELITLIETITRQYARTITTRDLEDGVSKTHRTGMFRAQFKDALMSAMAEGFGGVLSSSGKVFIPYIRKFDTLEGYANNLPSESYRS
jgi:hypothetical protein